VGAGQFADGEAEQRDRSPSAGNDLPARAAPSLPPPRDHCRRRWHREICACQLAEELL